MSEVKNLSFFRGRNGTLEERTTREPKDFKGAFIDLNPFIIFVGFTRKV